MTEPRDPGPPAGEGAVTGVAGGRPSVLHYGDPAAEALRAARTAGVADLSASVLLRVTGKDRLSYLHRILTCPLKDLAPGTGVRGLLLTARGKVVADLDLSVLENRVDAQAPAAARSSLVEGLRRFLIADDCEVVDRAGEEALLAVVGPLCGEVVARVLDGALPALEPEGAAAVVAAGHGATLFRRDRYLLPGFRIQVDAGAADDLREALFAAAAAAGGGPVGTEGLEILRVEAGEPALGGEFGEETLPQEAGLTDRVSFTKGCFLGQEPVARLQNRGHTNRGLVGLDLGTGGVPPPPGTAILVDGREVGVLGTAVSSARLGRTVALALLRHEHAVPGTAVTLGNGTAAVVVPLPFTP